VHIARLQTFRGMRERHELLNRRLDLLFTGGKRLVELAPPLFVLSPEPAALLYDLRNPDRLFGRRLFGRRGGTLATWLGGRLAALVARFFGCVGFVDRLGRFAYG